MNGRHWLLPFTTRISARLFGIMFLVSCIHKFMNTSQHDHSAKSSSAKTLTATAFQLNTLRWVQKHSFSPLRSPGTPSQPPLLPSDRNNIFSSSHHQAYPFFRTMNSSSSTRIFQSKEPLAREGDWAAYADEETTGLIYYFNSMTGASIWEPPTPTFPKVEMSQRKKKKLMTIRKQYFERQAIVQKQQPKPSVQEQVQQQVQQLQNLEGKEKQKRMNNKSTGLKEAKNDIKNSTGGEFLGGLVASVSLKKKVATPLIKEVIDTNALLDSDRIGNRSDSTPRESRADSQDIKNELRGGFFNLFATAKVSREDRNITQSTESKSLISDNSDSVSSSVNDLTLQNNVNRNSIEKKTSTRFLNRFFATTDTVESTTTINSSQTNGLSIDVSTISSSTTKSTASSSPSSIVPPLSKATLQIQMVSKVLPHPAKVSWGGEDAVFCSGRCFGVFDGVSGANKEDGKPLYSVTLANQLKNALVDRDGLTINQLRSILMDASLYADSCSTGASTALVASIGDDGFLRAINLGDSVLMVIRNEKILAKTRERIHYFDCPYQLSIDSPDRPKDSTSLQIELLPGDIVIAGSDGLFDNLSEDSVRSMVVTDTLSTTSSIPVSDARLGSIAKKILDQSRLVSLDSESSTPYALMAKRNGYENYQTGKGGKVDDVSCVIVRCS